MSDKPYTIKDVAEILETEAYVLRYYEKELHLDIKRNSQGHRVYGLEDIENFQKIKGLREQGLQLKAIENVIHEIEEPSIGSIIELAQVHTQRGLSKRVDKEETDITSKEDEKVKQFSLLMKEMLKQALVEYDDQSKEQIKEELTEEVHTIVNKKFIELEVTQKEKDDLYYRKIDETMREMQKLRQSISELEQGDSKEKVSVWKKLFKTKNKSFNQIKVEEKDL